MKKTSVPSVPKKDVCLVYFLRNSSKQRCFSTVKEAFLYVDTVLGHILNYDVVLNSFFDDCSQVCIDLSCAYLKGLYSSVVLLVPKSKVHCLSEAFKNVK